MILPRFLKKNFGINQSFLRAIDLLRDEGVDLDECCHFATDVERGFGWLNACVQLSLSDRVLLDLPHIVKP